ncbi:hypothetical protein R83H12_00438 [Fibrobacteria bacterium R8-3-H12]
MAGSRVVLESESGSDSLLIPSNPYPMYPHVEVLNTVAIDSATGHRHVFASGPVRVNASIQFKNLSHSFVKEYENFILNIARLGKNPFKIICPDYIDFGLGKGEPIPQAYYSGSPNLKDIISSRDDAGLFYDIELPYMFVRENYAQG